MPTRSGSPAVDLIEFDATSGQAVRAPRGAKFSRFDSFDGTQYAVYRAGPGTYQFNG